MINNPPIDDLAEKVGSKYALCVVASKRARQIIDHAQSQGLNDLPGKIKPLTAAAEEIEEGKVTVSRY
ncbi:MAG: DNA-directed RNA polymerase subunit omega [Clostridia bacterium]|nr:DNA-directed RNA polymerase subunit omega [Clostridia bacterium]